MLSPALALSSRIMVGGTGRASWGACLACVSLMVTSSKPPAQHGVYRRSAALMCVHAIITGAASAEQHQSHG
jgi:DNA-binding MurR/RpiR family transcriptional regulator